MARNAVFPAFALQPPWNRVCLSTRASAAWFRGEMKSRLYILVAGAILIATWGTTVGAESGKGGPTGKKKMQLILVVKKERDRSGANGKTERTRPENHRQR